jgi:glutathione synthase
MRILFITSPWECLDHDFDSSLYLLKRASEIFGSSFWADIRSIAATISGLTIAAVELLANSPGRSLPDYPLTRLNLADFNLVFLRMDAPFASAYSQFLRLLVYCETRETHVRFVNSPKAILAASSKTNALWFDRALPATIVSADRNQLLKFCDQHRETVLKKLDHADGRGVFHISAEHNDRMVTLLTEASANFSEPVLLQQRLSNSEPELRVWYLDGHVLARTVVNRNAPHGTCNLIESPSSTEHSTAIDQVGATLSSLELRFGAVDFLDGRPIDINICSPGLIRETIETTGVDFVPMLFI